MSLLKKYFAPLYNGIRPHSQNSLLSVDVIPQLMDELSLIHADAQCAGNELVCVCLPSDAHWQGPH